MYSRVLLIVFVLSTATTSNAQQACRSLFFANATNFTKELLQVQGHIQIGSIAHDGSFSEIAQHPDIKLILESKKNIANQILGTVEVPDQYGGGKLKLVSLDTGIYNQAYNHIELVAFLNVNPSLANRIGFFKVDGYENIVWVPDIIQVNQRLKLIAKEFGIQSAQWEYSQADGVVPFKPYINLLAAGKFPFSNDSDVNLSVHDVMHAVSFAALNSTDAAREVMEIAKKRNASVVNIYNKLASHLPEVAYAFESKASLLASDPMERTMLLTILMTGNFGYFSPNLAKKQGRDYSLQNKEITVERVKSLLKLFSQGAVNFSTIYHQLNLQLSDPAKKTLLKDIFSEEINKTFFATDAVIDKAGREIVDYFFPAAIFSQSSEVKEVQEKQGTAFGTRLGFSFSPNEDILR